MADKALLFWRVWAAAAVLATAVPSARLAWPRSPPPVLPREHAAPSAAPSKPDFALAPAEPAQKEDALLARLAVAQTGNERCELCERLPVSDAPRVTYAITGVLERATLGSVRVCATQALGLQPTAEARSWLVELADDPQVEVQRAALNALAAAADAPARSVVTEATHSDDAETRLSAVSALLLAKRSEAFQAAALVLPGLEDRDALLSLIDTLGQSHDAQAVPALLALISDGERESHLHAIAALGDLGAVAAVPELEGLLESDSPEEFRAAADALKKLAPEAAFAKLRAQLGSSDEQRRSLALALLLDSDRPEVATLLRDQLRSADGEQARVVLQHLTAHPDPAFEAELDDFASTHPEQKRAALYALRAIGTPSALASVQRLGDDATLGRKDKATGRALMTLARDPSEAAQAKVLEFLENPEQQPRAVPMVIAAAPASTVEQVLARANGWAPERRRALIEGLGQRGEPRFSQTLREALRDPDESTRNAALRGLAELGDQAATDETARLSRASDSGDRALAVELLALRDDAAAQSQVQALTSDASMEVVCGALRALEARSPELVLPLAQRAFRAASSEDRVTLLDNLNDLSSSILRPLDELAISEGDDSAALTAVQSLASLEGPESAQRLLSVASDNNRSPEVRTAAASGLRQLGGPLLRSNRALIDTLSPPDDPGVYTCNTNQ